jgi:hypothetical protein
MTDIENQEMTPGQLVRVRSRQYLIEEVIPPTAAQGDTQVRLACPGRTPRGLLGAGN